MSSVVVQKNSTLICELRPQRIKASVFPFFMLPVELREEVYSHCYGHSVYRFTEVCYNFNLTIGNPQDRFTCGHLPVWLQTCKQMLREGLDCLYSWSTCTIWVRSRKTQGPRSYPRLLVFGRVQSLELGLALSVTQIQGSSGLQDQQLGIALDPKSSLTGTLLSLTELLVASGSSLRSLTIRLMTPYSYCWNSNLDEMPIKAPQVDLSMLEGLGTKLVKLHFIVPEPQLDTSAANSLVCAEMAYIALQRELVAVARRKVGHPGSARGIKLRDWLQKETFEGDQSHWNLGERQARSDWHLEACYTGRASRGGIQYEGMATWEDINGKDTRFQGRKEGLNGKIEWQSTEYGKIEIILPKNWDENVPFASG